VGSNPIVAVEDAQRTCCEDNVEHELTWEIDPATGHSILVVVEVEPFAKPDSWPWVEYQPARSRAEVHPK
jgi:hypothetical protein